MKAIYSMRNTIFILAVLPFFLLLNGCADLQPADYSDIPFTDFPKNEEDIKSLVLSCYYPLRPNWFNGIHARNERGVMVINDATTEVLGNDELWFTKRFIEMDYHPETTDVTWFYYGNGTYDDGGFANKISRCTLVMDQIENSSLREELKEKYMAEVRCARAFLSYILYDMYGPLVVAPLEVLKKPLREEPLPRLSREEMVKVIEDDLFYAAEKLPMPDKTEYGKFSRGLARMLLIRLYLHEAAADNAYYAKVETLCRELMKPEYGYQLQSDYVKMFESGGQGLTNKENIWAIPVTADSPAGEGNDWHMFVLPTDFNQEGMKGGYGVALSTWWFYDRFEEKDVRKTYLLKEYTNNKGTLITRTSEKPLLGPIPMKFGYDPGVAGVGKSTIDIIIYRYADVYLSLAEAIAMKEGHATQEAVDLMNTIRTRAKLPAKQLSDFATLESFIDQILTERSHEFWCENGQYRADLIRHNKLMKRAKELTNTAYAGKEKELFPLPKIVIVDGKGKVQQNSGY